MSHKNEEIHSAGRSWLMSFGDMLSLMLTFFVMLYAMSMTSQTEFSEFKDGVAQKIPPSKFSTREQGIESLPIVRQEISFQLEYAKKILGAHIRKNKNLEDMGFQSLPSELILSLPGSWNFEQGQTAVTPKMTESIRSLAPILSNLPVSIEVRGFGDPIPYQKDQSKTSNANWELAIDRAKSFANLLKNSGYPNTITIQGASLDDAVFLESLGDQFNVASSSNSSTKQRRVQLVLRPYAPKPAL